MKRNGLKYGIIGICCALVGLFFTALCSVSVFGGEYALNDSSVFRYIAREIQNGALPYRDTFDHKGPLIYLINYIGLLISPRLGIWIIEWLGLSLTAFFCYITAERASGYIPAAFATLAALGQLSLYFQGGNLTEEYAMPLISLALFLFYDYFDRDESSPLRLVACGFAGGLVLMLRPNMAVAWLVFPIGVLINELVKKRGFRLLRYLLPFVGGVAAAIVPFVLWYAAFGGLSDLFDSYIGFNLLYGQNGELTFKETVLHFFKQPLLHISVLSLIIALIVKRNRLFDACWLSFLAVSLAALSMSGRTYMHYGMILIPAFVYPISLIGSYGSFKGTALKKAARAVGTVAVAIVLAVYSLTGIKMAAQNIKISVFNNEAVNPIPEPLVEIASYISYNTDEKDKITVVGNRNLLYNITDRYSATEYSYQYPIAVMNEELRMKFYEELRVSSPKLIIVANEIPDIYGYLDQLGYREVYGNTWCKVYRR